MKIRRAVFGALAIALLTSPHALAGSSTTTVVKDPGGDVTNLAGLPANDPSIDLLDVGVTADATSITTVIHVADVDARGDDPLASGEDAVRTARFVAHGVTIGLVSRTDYFGKTTAYAFVDQFTYCTVPASAALDLVANTVTTTAAIADLNGCPSLAGTPIAKGTVLSEFGAGSASTYLYAGLVGTGLTGARDQAAGNATYTVGK